MILLLLSVLLLSFTVGIYSNNHIGSLDDRKYRAECTFGVGTKTTFSQHCNVALFSVGKDFSITGSLSLLQTEFCESNIKALSSQTKNSIVSVKRGGCSFDTKAKHALEAGYGALILVNTDDIVFPPGGNDDPTLVPTVMVGNSFWQELQRICGEKSCPDVTARISYVSSDRPRKILSGSYEMVPDSEITTNIGYFCLACIVACIVVPGVIRHIHALTTSKHSESSVSRGRTMFMTTSMVCVLLVGLILRLATLRRKKVDVLGALEPGLQKVVHNHREMDEVIFETLVGAVSKNFFDYSLRNTDLVQTYQLSSSNYNDALFIHPPFFVYFLYSLNYIGLSLPMASVFMHIATAGLMYPLTILLYSTPLQSKQECNKAHVTAMWGVVVYLFCPIAAFCSQKIWIDNAAAFTVVLCAVLHLYFCRRSNSRTLQHLLQLVSGFAYGLLALNCKITNWALMPSLLCWTIFNIYFHHREVGTAISCAAIFLFGIAGGHGPWVFVYHAVTGRWIPNAWPSEEMVRNSVYLQNALSQHPLFYMSSTFAVSPLHVVGTLYAIGVGVYVIFRPATTCQCEIPNINTKLSRSISVVIFALWPACFFAGLTLVGILGGGYQIRFILPALPATSILAGMCVVRSGAATGPLVAFLLCYSTIHVLYYAVLFPPLFGAPDMSIFQIISHIRSSMLSDDRFMEDMIKITEHMAHFGLVLRRNL